MRSFGSSMSPLRLFAFLAVFIWVCAADDGYLPPAAPPPRNASAPSANGDDVASATAFYKCNGITYDDTFSLCCNGALVSRPANGACCGRTAYDWTRNLCCNGVLNPNPNPGTSYCCGTQSYDSQTAICCGATGSLYQRSQFGGAAALCCGNAAYNGITADCNGVAVVPKCPAPSPGVCCVFIPVSHPSFSPNGYILACSSNANIPSAQLLPSGARVTTNNFISGVVAQCTGKLEPAHLPSTLRLPTSTLLLSATPNNIPCAGQFRTFSQTLAPDGTFAVQCAGV